MEKIICAVVMYGKQPVCGIHHGDCYKTIRILTGKNLSEIEGLNRDNMKNHFLTSNNRVVDRYEAWAIAEKANQILYGYEACKGEDAFLISENLYQFE